MVIHGIRGREGALHIVNAAFLGVGGSPFCIRWRITEFIFPPARHVLRIKGGFADNDGNPRT